MSTLQDIRTPSHEEIVVLSSAYYDALVTSAGKVDEGTADAAIYEACGVDIAAARPRRIQPQVVAAMQRGEALLKALRKWRGLTLLEKML